MRSNNNDSHLKAKIALISKEKVEVLDFLYLSILWFFKRFPSSLTIKNLQNKTPFEDILSKEYFNSESIKLHYEFDKPTKPTISNERELCN